MWNGLDEYENHFIFPGHQKTGEGVKGRVSKFKDCTWWLFSLRLDGFPLYWLSFRQPLPGTGKAPDFCFASWNPAGSKDLFCFGFSHFLTRATGGNFFWHGQDYVICLLASLPRHPGWIDTGAKNWQSSVGLSAYSQSCGGGSVVLNQYWEEREIVRSESQSPGFQKKDSVIKGKQDGA